MKKIISTIALMACCIAAFAQASKEKTEVFSSFNAISASNCVAVTLEKGSKYSVTLKTDARIADYCRMYVQGSTLVIDIDEKSYPNELKAQLRKKDSAPVFAYAEVTIPSAGTVQSLSLNDEATFSAAFKLELQHNFSVSTTGSAIVKSLNVSTNEDIMVNAAKKSSVSITAKGTSVTLNSDNQSVISADVTAVNATANIAANSTQNIKGNISTILANGAGSGKAIINAQITSLEVIGKGNSTIDARESACKNATVNLTSCKAYIHATGALKVTLSSGAYLAYDGTPDFDIVSVKNSSIIRLGEEKK